MPLHFFNERDCLQEEIGKRVAPSDDTYLFNTTFKNIKLSCLSLQCRNRIPTLDSSNQTINKKWGDFLKPVCVSPTWKIKIKTCCCPLKTDWIRGPYDCVLKEIANPLLRFPQIPPTLAPCFFLRYYVCRGDLWLHECSDEQKASLVISYNRLICTLYHV